VTAEINAGELPSLANAVKANGSNTVTINVVGGTKAPITVKTKKGSFEGGVTTTTIESVSGSVDLTVCDAHNDTAGVSTANCAGSVTVTATDAAGATGRVTLKFIGYETACTDGADSNQDGRTDCADPDCDQGACTTANGAAGTCKSNVCTPASCSQTNPTEICNNNVDDNCDGKIDCAESTCDGQACKAGSPTFVCQSQVCTDQSSGIGLTLTPARARLPADGLATTTVKLVVTKDKNPLPNTLVTFTTNLGGFLIGSGIPAVSTTTASTDSDGTATVTFQADEDSGVATVTAAINSAVSTIAYITLPALGAIQIGALQNPVMGVRSSGWNEQNQISVLLLDTEQKPYPDGLMVRFEHQQFGGSSISQPWTDSDDCKKPTVAGANGCLGYEAVVTSPADKPDTSGLAYVNLYSGNASGLPSVQVTATAGKVTRSYTIQDIAIVGAKTSGAHISLDCTPKSIPALMTTDCIRSTYRPSKNLEAPINCTAHFADRFGNVLGKATEVTFASENYSAGQPVWTDQYDPKSTKDQTASLGFAMDSIKTWGHDLPKDVPPVGSEPSDTHADECPARTHNPRDGLVSVIVKVQGEEGFVDMNGNGVWDSGEPFVDQGEPFVDDNDNGTHDDGEQLWDTNGNGQWDGPNGKWDANTVIWAEARVVYTSLPRFALNFSEAGSLSGPVLSSANGQTATSATAGFYFSDTNMNPLPPIFTKYDVTSEFGYTTDKILFAPTGVDSLGMSFTQQYCSKQKKDMDQATVCSSTCLTSPCYVVPNVSNYATASYGVVQITGGSTGNVTDLVDVTAAVDGVTERSGVRIAVPVQ
jgi:hypothetical protein